MRPIRALLLGDKAFGRSLKVAFDKMIPTKHPYIAAFSKPRPVGRRRGRPISSSKQTDVGNQTHLLAPTMDCIRPSLSACIARRKRNSCSAARPTWQLAEAVERFCRRPVATPSAPRKTSLFQRHVAR